MKNILLIIIIFLLGGLGVFYVAKGDAEQAEFVIEAPQEPEYQITEHIVEDGDVFAVIMETLGFDYLETMDILEVSSSTYDFTSIRVGKPFRLFKTEMGERVKLEYEKDSEEIATVEFKNGKYFPSLVPIEYETETNLLAGVVSSSLWFSGLEVGMPEELIIEFADVFAWTVDFSVQTRKGDGFKVLYEKRFRDGEYVGIGRVLAGEFVNSGTSYKAYLFEDKDGGPAYFSETGEAMQKQFLKAPLSYSRITSGFSYARFHPVTQSTGPHRAIDYAAPIGTPIMSVGDGTVMQASWNGGYGNFISVHHNDTYTTEYAHLSSYARGIRRGIKVKQGEVIGYVGSTGWSTGPHLHYQIKKYGTLVNPLEIELPPGDPVAEDRRAEFESVVREFDKEL
jgi:murein DD-endopeptidase MepM/ murein hydrolase activator NlpD